MGIFASSIKQEVIRYLFGTGLLKDHFWINDFGIELILEQYISKSCVHENIQKKISKDTINSMLPVVAGFNVHVSAVNILENI